MRHTRTSKSAPVFPQRNATMPLLFAAGLSLLAPLTSVCAAKAAGGPSGFQPYKDAHAGFALSKPDGWHVRTGDLNIWVESPDKSELVLMRAFTPEAGQSALDWLQTLGTQYDAAFPQATLDHAEHIQSGGDEITADMHYQGPKGPARARLLCRIVNGKGLAYVFAAPADRYSAEQTKMLHVAQSIAFFAPKGASSGGNSGSDGKTMTAAQLKTVGKSMHFVKWLEPTEHAYTLSIPQSWKVTSTMHRHGGPMPTFFYAVSSPQEDIGIMYGTPDLLYFTEPNQMTRMSGQQEGQNGILHYMRAPEFNEFFLRKILGSAFSDLTIESSQENEKAAQQIAAHVKNPYNQTSASAGFTTFKATEAKTGKKIEGILISSTICTTMPIAGGEEMVTWYANPQMITTKAGDAQADARQQKAVVAFLRTGSSFLETPEWMAKENAEFQVDIKAKGDAMIENSRRASAAIAANSDDARNRLMSNFHNHEAAMDNQQRGFINYLGNRTDVSDGAGHTANVASGSSHYYKNDRTGTIVGTNSAYSPGVDLTPMKEY